MILHLTAEEPVVGALVELFPEAARSSQLSFGRVHWERPEPRQFLMFVELDPARLLPDNLETLEGAYGMGYGLSLVMAVVLGRYLFAANGVPEEWSREVELSAQWGPLRGATHSAAACRWLEGLGFSAEAELAGDVFWLKSKGRSSLFGALRGFYLLNAALDRQKHHWVEERELRRLASEGDRWMGQHPHWREWRSLLLPPSEDLESQGSMDQDLRFLITSILMEREVSTVAQLGAGRHGPVLSWLDYPQIRKLLFCSSRVKTLETAQLLAQGLASDLAEKLEIFQSGWAYTDRRLQRAEALVLSDLLEVVPSCRRGEIKTNLLENLSPELAILAFPRERSDLCRWVRDLGEDFNLEERSQGDYLATVIRRCD